MESSKAQKLIAWEIESRDYARGFWTMVPGRKEFWKTKERPAVPMNTIWTYLNSITQCYITQEGIKEFSHASPVEIGHENPWKYMDVHGISWWKAWIFMLVYEKCCVLTTWKFIDFHVNPSLATNGNEQFVWVTALHNWWGHEEIYNTSSCTCWQSSCLFPFKQCIQWEGAFGESNKRVAV